ncbi:MAG: hypothetical protein NTW31_00135, partial [Bacteroidetes bacterium]|nr:hypothetical protein [Bacteroidota bacterium]
MTIWKALTRFLIHPVFISLAVTIFIIVLFIPIPGKYILLIEDKALHDQTASIVYSDLDGNG